MNYHEGKNPDGVHYNLRRNIHRLEKAMTMFPRRDTFAVDYIEETIRAYKDCVNGIKLSSPEELAWAHDVLSEYFRIVVPTKKIDIAHEKFDDITFNPSNAKLILPRKRGVLDIPVCYDDLYKLALIRRSVRFYLPKSVSRTDIDKAIEIALLSPSACNRQPFEFKIIDDSNLLKEIVPFIPGAEGFGEGLPVLVVVVGKLRAFFNERDRHLIYIDASLTSMSFMFALETLGISSCCINCPETNQLNKKVGDKLRLGADERIILFVSLGYANPDGMIPFSKKKNIDLIRSYNN
jgi:nitroreductase